MSLRKSPQREREILAAALRVMRMEGANNASTAKIAAQARCSKETLYNWFGDRDGLLASLVETQTQVMLEQISRAEGRASQPVARLEAYCAALLDLLSGDAHRVVCHAVVSQNWAGPSKAAKNLIERFQKIEEAFIELLEEARCDGQMHYEDVGLVYQNLIGLVLGTNILWTMGSVSGARPSGDEMQRIAKCAVVNLRRIYRLESA